MAGNKKPNTVSVAENLVKPILEELGLILWDTRFEREGGSWFLRYFVDREESGVTIADLEQVSKRVDKLLDEADPITQSYTLEVCSPGIERLLSKDWHYQRYVGQPVNVRLIRPVEGRRDFVGVLMGKEKDTVTIQMEDGDVEMVFLTNEAAYVRLYAQIEFGGQE